MRNINKITPVSLSVVTMFYFLGSTSSLAMEDVVDEVTHSYMKLKKSHNANFGTTSTENNSLFEKFTSFINTNVTNTAKSFGWLNCQFMNSSPSSFKWMKEKENFVGPTYFFNYAYSQGSEERKFKISSDNRQKPSLSKKTVKLKTDELNIDDLNEELNVIDEMLNNIKIPSFVTVIIGNTGVGKTAVFNSIQDLPINAYLDETWRDYRIKGKGVATTFQAGTITYPNISEAGDIFDCPGFGNNGGLKQDIINAYSLHKFFEKVTNFNLLVVVEMSEFSVIKAAPFINLLDHIEKLFPDKDADKLKKGFNLVISKGEKDQNNVEYVKNIIRQIEEDRSDLSDFKRDMLKFLYAKNNDQITFFEKPEGSGEVKVNHNFIKGKSYIKGLKASISVTDDTEKNIMGAANEVADNIATFFTAFKKELPKHTNNFIQEYKYNANQKIKPAQEIRNTFGSFSNSLEEVTSQFDNFDSDKNNIESVIKTLDTKSWESLSALLKQRELFNRVRFENTPINVSLNQGKALEDLDEELALLSTRVKFFPTKKLRIEGYIVGTSDIQDQITGAGKTPGVIVAQSLHSLIIDENIIAPGASIVLASPFWTVIDKKKIDLKGSDGLFTAKKLQKGGSGKAGENGKPGEPGQSGGNFYGLVSKIYNSENLTIDVRGGKGGKGQNGGDGGDGQDGQLGNMGDVENKSKNIRPYKEDHNYTLLESFFILLGANQTDRLMYRSGDFGKKGGDGGEGGRGGRGGLSGSIWIKTFNGQQTQNRVNEYIGIGDQGENGDHGKPGKGGKNEPVFEGVWCEEVSPKEDGYNFSLEPITNRGTTGFVAGSATKLIYWYFKSGSWNPLSSGVIGAAVGIFSPKVGNMIINGKWLYRPREIYNSEYAKDGKVPSKYNTELQAPPEKNIHLDNSEIDEIRSKFL